MSSPPSTQPVVRATSAPGATVAVETTSTTVSLDGQDEDQPASRPSTRLDGLDAARAVAIAGMIAVHAIPRDDGIAAEWVLRLVYGRASLLFVVLAGAGVGLLTRHAARGRVQVLMWRATVLLLAGLGLQLLDHDVSVILPTYGVLFALAAVIHRTHRTALLAAGLVSLLLGPVIWLAAQGERAMAPSLPVWGDPPGRIASDLLLSGPYPVIVWVAPFLVGMWLGRVDLRAVEVQGRLVVGGVLAALGGLLVSWILIALAGEPSPDPGWDRLISAVAHSQMPLSLISGVGSALAVIGGLLYLTPRVGRWSWPLTTLGRASLTVYVGHLFVLAALVRPGPDDSTTGLLLATAMTAGAAALSSLWFLRWRRGPLETALQLPDLSRLTRPSKEKTLP